MIGENSQQKSELPKRRRALHLVTVSPLFPLSGISTPSGDQRHNPPVAPCVFPWLRLYFYSGRTSYRCLRILTHTTREEQDMTNQKNPSPQSAHEANEDALRQNHQSVPILDEEQLEAVAGGAGLGQCFGCFKSGGSQSKGPDLIRTNSGTIVTTQGGAEWQWRNEHPTELQRMNPTWEPRAQTINGRVYFVRGPLQNSGSASQH